MAESSALLAEIAAMRNQLDDVSSITAALLRNGAEELAEQIVEYLTADEAARRVFLMSDGMTTQADILSALQTGGIAGGSGAGVSRRIDRLVNDFHLLAHDRRAGNSKVYRRTEVARALHIERRLKKLGLGL